MPNISDHIDSLIHLDIEPNAAERTAIKSQIASELSPDHTNTLHPSVSERYTFEPQFSNVVQIAHDAIAQNGGQLVSSNAIDTSRYEAPSAPEDPSDTEAWKSTLKRAYTSTLYLEDRAENLRALDENGKNAWLVANSQVEDELRGLEKELRDIKSRSNMFDEERRQRQEGVRGEMEGLEETWRKGLERAIQAEVAVEQVKAQVLERRRELALGT